MYVCGGLIFKIHQPWELIIIFSKEVREMKGGATKVIEEACSRQREQQV